MASGTSSYLYAGLDGETSELALELGRFEVTAVVNERLVPHDKTHHKVLWVHGKTVGLRNASLPRATPSADAMSYVSVSGSSSLAALVQRPQDSPLDPHGIADWVLDGFNACVLAYGGRGDGKTLALFGADTPPDLAEPCLGPNSVAPQTNARSSSCVTACVLRRLYERAGLPLAAGTVVAPPHLSARRSGCGEGDYNAVGRGTTIALSCWVVRASAVEDLLANPKPNPKSTPLRGGAQPTEADSSGYAAVECGSLDAALAVVAAARSRAPGCALRPADGNNSSSTRTSEAARGHFFVRVLVHRSHIHPQDKELQSSSSIGSNPNLADLLSHLHIVDLLGHATPDLDPQYQRLSEPDRVARREQALQLQALHRTLGAIRMATGKGKLSRKGKQQQPAVTSGRDSVLTAQLAPLLQGNCRTSLLAFLRDGEGCYRGSKATLAAVAELAGVLQPCHRVSAVPVAALGLLSTDTVLPPLLPAHTRQQQAGVSGTDTDAGDSSRQDGGDGAVECTYDAFDLAAVAAGAVDRSPGRSVGTGRSGGSCGSSAVNGSSGSGALGRLNSQFGAVLRQQRVGEANTNDNTNTNGKAQTADSVQQSVSGPLSGSHAYAQYLEQPPRPARGRGDTALLVQAHAAGLYRCVREGGLAILDRPLVAAASVGSLLSGDAAEFAAETRLAADDDSACFARLRTGGWVRIGGGALERVTLASRGGQQYRVVSSHGTFIRDRPTKNAANVGGLAHDAAVEASGRQETEVDGLSYVQVQLTGGGGQGWVPLVSSAGRAVLEPVPQSAGTALAEVERKDGPSLTVEVEGDGRDALSSPPRKAATSAPVVSGSPFAQSPTESEKLSPFSPVSGQAALVLQASGHQQEFDRMRKKKVAPPTIDHQSHSAHASPASFHTDALVASKLLLRARSAKERLGQAKPQPPADMDVSVPTGTVTVQPDFVGQLRSIYSQYNPAKVADVPIIISHFRGREQQLLHELHKKYRIPFPESESEGLAEKEEPSLSGSPTTRESESENENESGGEGEGEGESGTPSRNTETADTLTGVFEDSAAGGSRQSYSPKSNKMPRSALKAQAGEAIPLPAAAIPRQPKQLDPNPNPRSDLGQGSSTYPASGLTGITGITLSEAGAKALQMTRGTGTGGNTAAAAQEREVAFLDVSTASAGSHVDVAAINLNLSEVSGLTDTAAAAEVDVLRRNTASLLESLGLERRALLAAQGRADCAEAEAEEVASALDVAREDARLDAHRQRAQLQLLTGANGPGKDLKLAPLFRLYEEQVERAELESEQLRQRNIELENCDLAATCADARDSVNTRSVRQLQLGASRSMIALSAAARVEKAAARLKCMAADNAALHRTVTELRKSQRQHAVGLRVQEHASSRLAAAHAELVHTQAALTEAQDQLQQATATCATLRADSAVLQASDGVLREEWGGVQQELALLRRRVSDVDEERWRQAQLDLLAAPGVAVAVPDLLPTEGGSAAGGASRLRDGPSYSQPTEAWVASRPEGLLPEAEPHGAAALEASLSELHARLVEQAPALLPLLRRVGNCVHHERASHLQARADMLQTVYPTPAPSIPQRGGSQWDTAESRQSQPVDRRVGVGSGSSLTGLVSDSTVKRAVNSRRADEAMVAVAFANIRYHDGVYVEPVEGVGAGPLFVWQQKGSSAAAKSSSKSKSSSGVDTAAALAELRGHRKTVRDAHALRSSRS